MSLGVGTLATSQKKEPAGAPFPANSAYNGVSVDPNNGRIVLGDDSNGLATLVSNRFIDNAGFGVYLYGTGIGIGNEVAILPGSVRVSVDFADGSPAFELSDFMNNIFLRSFLDNTNGNGVIYWSDSVPRGSCIIMSAGEVTVALNPSFNRTSSALLEVAGPIATDAPSANGQGEWKLGKVVAAAVALDNTQYVEVMIDGNVVRLAVVT